MRAGFSPRPERNVALRHEIRECQPLEIPGFGIAEPEFGIAHKSEAAVIAGITKDDASLGIAAHEPAESFDDQSAPYALPLTIGPDRDWAQSVPPCRGLDRNG